MGIIVNLTAEQTKVGYVYEVNAVGKELFDPDTGESLGKREYTVGEIKITKTLPKMSEATTAGDLTFDKLQPGMILRRVSEKKLSERRKVETNKAKKRFEKKF